MEEIQSLLNNIKAARKERGWDQVTMAEKLSMSQTGYSKIERGETKMSLEMLLKITKILEFKDNPLLPARTQDDEITLFENKSLKSYFQMELEYAEKRVKRLKKMLGRE